MDVDSMGSAIKNLSHSLPFYHGMKAVRMAVLGEPGDALKPLLITLAYATVIYILAIIVMRGKMKKDVR